MKRKINILFAVIIAVFLILWYLGSLTMSSAYKDAVVLLAGCGIVCVLYILNRLIIFRKKFELAMRHILENNFQTGISLPGNDEFSFLAQKFNDVVDRINKYDRLREDRVDILNKQLSILNRNIINGVMLLDQQSGRVKINKAAQEVFEVNQDELSIDSVIKLEANSEFNKLYYEIVNRRANTIAADIELFLPVLRAKAAVSLKMFAIKDKDEKLNSILCVFTKA
ncbi:MAG: hypothetical protein KJ893_09850 [Candidatus Omnitrophica bacterium]|nr:hypothetical protein [Candidatus Omnitrophota bacterium]MBU4479285.1 hypothetical protein [Candidatus Omnitrophota bacterium]MCG2703266.1 hypothetical protein [Candidatus Omnitrophota bacterium]